MRNVGLRGASAAAVVIGLTLSSAAVAQEATPTTPPEDSDRARDVVIVTANKREETVQDVAVAITAITSETRDELGIKTITDLTNVTPGLAYTSFTDRVSLRGVGRFSNAFGADPGVANYSDGIYTSFAVTAGRNNIFTDRIEVLRGPQGTLYGRNSIGGALNVISKRPSDTLEREVRVGAGNYDYRFGAFSVSGPLTDDIRGRVAGSYEARDGFFRNVADGSRGGNALGEWILEGQLEGDIGDRFSWWVKGTTVDWDKAGGPGGQNDVGLNAPYETPFAPPGGGLNPNPAWAFSGDPNILSFRQLGNVTTNPAATSLSEFNWNKPTIARFDAYHELTAEAVYQMDTFDIKWLGGYVFYDFRFIMDNDQTPVQSITYRASPTGAPSSTGTPLTIFPETEINYRETRAFFSNELNLVSTGSGPLQWILGAYAYQENSQRPIYLTLPQEPMADSVLSLVTFQQIPNPERAMIYTNGKNLFNAYGAYGQADYEFNDQWKVTAGARYSLDLKSIREEGFMRCLIVCGAPIIDLTPVTQTGAAPGFVGPQPGVATATATNTSGIIYDPVKGQSYRLLKDSWDAVTGTLGVEYRPMDGALLFGRYSRGYKSGGFNSEFFSPLPRTDEETMDSYEIGWKQEWMDWDLTTNLALFHYNYHDTQIPLTVDPPLGLNYSQFVNIPEIESNGVELESFWRPVDDLQLMFTYAYLDTEVTESGGLYFNALTQVSQDITGNPLPFASKNKVAFNARYTFHLPDGSTLMPSVNYFWRDSFATNIFNHPRGEAPSYGQTDARLIWNDTGGQYTVSAWVRNVFDDEGYESVGASLQQSTGQILQSITPTPPRTYGVELQFRF